MVLLRSCLEALTARADGRVSVPRFDKAEDDRFVEAAWTQIEGPIDVVLLEGWCMGARSVAPAELKEPLNTLELEEDLDGAWRAFVNDSLKSDFEPLYGQIDLWVMLAAPDFEQVLAWRTEQEDKLRAKRRDQGAGLMDPAQLRRFVDHFERVTRQCLSTLPAEVDILLQLNAQRQIIEVRGLET
jgi:D-glycerate 3-kinase